MSARLTSKVFKWVVDLLLFTDYLLDILACDILRYYLINFSFTLWTAILYISDPFFDAFFTVNVFTAVDVRLTIEAYFVKADGACLHLCFLTQQSFRLSIPLNSTLELVLLTKAGLLR